MSADDEETSQNRLPPNAVTYNGVLTPYNNGATAGEGLTNVPDGQAYLTIGNSEITINGDRLVVDASDPAPISTSSTFASDAFAFNSSPLNHSAINGSDDDIYSIDEPLPDISDFADDEDLNQPDEDEDLNQSGAGEDYTKTVLNRTDNPPDGEAYLTDSEGNILTDSAGNLLTVNVLGGTATASTDFSFARGSASTFGNSTFGQSTYGQSANLTADGDTGSNGRDERAIEVLRQEMLDRMDRLEVLMRAQIDSAPNRGHNHPPQLLEVEKPATQAQLQEVLTAIAEIRMEGNNASPNAGNVVAQASVFQRVASLFKTGPGWLALTAISGIVGNAASDVFNAHQHEIYTALIGAADAALVWAQHLAAHL